MPNRPFQIAVVVDDGPGLGVRADAGTRQFARENPDFVVRRVPPYQLGVALRSLHFDGMVAQIASPAAMRVVRRFHGPVVNISGALKLDYPQCTMDNRAVGRLAAEHLCRRGYRTLAYTYLTWLVFSQERGAGFADVARESGRECLPIRLVITRDQQKARFKLEDAVARLIAGLPPRTGLFLAAWPSISLGTVARLAGKRIPEDIAVVTVGDDPAACDSEDPPVTSVEYPAEKIGYDAAVMLWGLLKGQKARTDPRLVAPTGVTPRASTGSDAIDDPEVRMAMQLIRSRARQDRSVNDILSQVLVSRSTLDRRFRAAVGKTPSEELRSQRLRHAQQLLAQTELPLAAVARRAGFRRPQHLCAVFRSELQTTPLGYRRQFQLRSGEGPG